jgi:hypothetical protein
MKYIILYVTIVSFILGCLIGFCIDKYKQNKLEKIKHLVVDNVHKLA